MKKRLFILLSLMIAMLPFTSAQLNAASVSIVLHVGYDDPTTNQGEPSRGPDSPEVSIDGYTLQFGTPCYGYTLLLLDGDGEEVYSTVVTSDTLVLPSTLEGEYEIMLIPTSGEIYFYGYVLF